MIINEQKNDVLVFGEKTSKRAGISANKTAKLQYLLTKGLYKDPITATIAEWTNNGIDAVVESGKDPILHPVLVKIETRGTQYVFSVEDTGVGLDDQDFENTCMEYLESTKEDRDDQIGCFGVGMKAFLGLERPATFICRKNGIERKYLVQEGEEFVDYDLLYEKPTEEGNGVKAEIIIKDYHERALFESKARLKLSYYDTAALVINDVPVISKIYRNELFQWTDGHSFTQMHLTLKDVYYPIDWEAIGMQPIQFPVAIRLALGEGLQPTPSRESYITNQKTKDLILRKIKEIANWFVREYNNSIGKELDFIDAYPKIDNVYKYVDLMGKQFKINNLLSHANVKLEDTKVKDAIIKTPTFYKDRIEYMVADYSLVAAIQNDSFKSKRFGWTLSRAIVDRTNTILQVDGVPVGNFKQFLKEKYGNDTFFVKKLDDLPLGKSSTWNSNSYRYFLNLTTVKKSLWRDYIKEFQAVRQTVIDTIIDVRSLIDSKEYFDWLEKKRADDKANRVSNPRASYSGLNKQAGDITLAYADKNRYGLWSWKKRVFPISGLKDNHYLTVLMTAEEKSEYDFIPALMSKRFATIKFAVAGKLEAKKIPDHYQFIKFKDFMKDCKAFKRLASAILFSQACEKYESIADRNIEIVNTCLKDFDSHNSTLEDYVANNFYKIDQKSQDAILELAKEEDLFDKELWDVYTAFTQELEKYDFIRLLEKPESINAARKKSYDKLIHQQLLFRKKYYNDIPEIV